MAHQFSFDILINNDHSLLIQFNDAPSKELSEYIYALSLAIPKIGMTGLVEVVSAYQSILVIFDIAQWEIESSQEQLNNFLKSFIKNFTTDSNIDSKSIIIPVCYDSRLAADLEDVCSQHKLSTHDFIELHSSPNYRVEMLGFLPGFLYLSGLNEKLQTPRKVNPALSVPAGSIAIGGNQTGVYSTSSPGGWHIVGRTPIKTLDLTKSSPAIANPLDTIKFQSISYQEFLDYEL